MPRQKNKARSDGLVRVTFTFNGKRYYCYGHTQKEADQRSRKGSRSLKRRSIRKQLISLLMSITRSGPMPAKVQ